MKIDFSEKNIEKIKTFCKDNAVETVKFLEGKLCITAYNYIELRINANKAPNVEIDKPATFLSALIAAKSVEVTSEKAKISGMEFTCSPSSGEKATLGRLCSFTKEQMKENFEKFFPMVRAVCWTDAKRAGLRLFAMGGNFSFIPAGIYSCMAPVKITKADFNPDMFDSHDSPINFNAAAMIFREEYYKMIQNFDYDVLDMYLPQTTEDAKVVLHKDGDEDIEIAFVDYFNFNHPNKAKLEKNIPTFLSKDKTVIGKIKNIKEFADTYCSVVGTVDDEIKMKVENGVLVPSTNEKDLDIQAFNIKMLADLTDGELTLTKITSDGVDWFVYDAGEYSIAAQASAKEE